MPSFRIPMRGPLLLPSDVIGSASLLLEQYLSGAKSSEEMRQSVVVRMQRFLGIERPMVPLTQPAVALSIALQLAGIGSADEVVAPTMAKASALMALSGGRVRLTLVDSDTLSWNMSEVALQRLIDERHQEGKPLPRALVLCHNYGMPSHVDALLGLARIHGMIVIEEASDALGSSYGGHPCGSLGDYAIVGLSPFSGEWQDRGVLLVCPNESRAGRARELAERTFREGEFVLRRSYECSSLLSGEEVFWTEVSLAYNLEVVSRARDNQHYLRELLAPAMGVRLLSPPSKDYLSNGVYSPILIDSSLLNFSAQELQLALVARGIEAQPMRHPLHKMAIFSGVPLYGTGVADQYSAMGLVLPTGAHLSQDEVGEMAEFIRNFIIRFN